MALDTKGKIRIASAIGLGIFLSFLAGLVLNYFSGAFPGHVSLVRGIVVIFYVPPMAYWVVAPIFRATGQRWR